LTCSRILMCESLCRFTSSDLFSTVVMSQSIFKTITAKILMSDCLTNILYATVSIMNMLIELKADFRLNVNLELTLDETALNDFDCLINLTNFSFDWSKESDFWLSWKIVKVNDLLSIWVEVKLFCFVIVLWLENRTISFWLEVKFENQRKSICIFITRLILFIHVFSKIIWYWSNRVINIKVMSIVWSWTVRFE